MTTNWYALVPLIAFVVLTSGQGLSLDQLIDQTFAKPADGSSTPPPDQTRNSDNLKDCDGGKCIAHQFCTNSSLNYGEGLLDIRNDFEMECSQYSQGCCPLADILTEPILPPINPSLNENEGCGYRNVDGVGYRISGASLGESEYGEFPWMVAVTEKQTIAGEVKNVYKCGGSLIHASVILTGAHCVFGKNPSLLIVRAGEWDTLNEDELYMAENRDIVEIITHENFNDKTLSFDVALLITASPFPLDIPTIATICLPPPNHVYAGAQCAVSGWGKDQFGKDGKYPNILKKIELPAITNAQCQTALRTSRLGNKFILHPTLLCAGEKGKDACRGDGGSPLVCPINNRRYYQAGIVAWGIGCGSHPGVYANIPVMREWIDKHMVAKGFGVDSYTFKA